MTGYDYGVISVFLVFMFSLGPIYKSFSKTSSDFFRGGGGMLWWVVGSSAFMSNFSAWSFTGGAAKAYETGTFFLVLFGCNIFALIICYIFTVGRFRQMRVITPVEGVRKRYGAASEQIFAWLPILSQAIFGGIMLYTIAVFMTGVFGISMTAIILILAAVIIGMTLIGGAWAATAGDFVQMLVVITITLIMATLTFLHPDIGGIRGLISKMPSAHFNWTEFARPSVITFFIITLVINQTSLLNSMLYGGARYVFVKDAKDGRKAVLVALCGFLFLSPVWMIPAIGASILHPDLASQYPQLNNPNEAAYVAIATTLLPPGLFGLLVCAIFAASLTTANSLLNVVSGTFVRNFYIKVIDRNASESKQILVGRVFILIYGCVWVLIALSFKNMKQLQLFDLILLAAASIAQPAALPMTYGLFIKKTPQWTGWSTMVFGFIVSIAVNILLSNSDFLQNLWGSREPLSARELGDLKIAITTGTIFVACNAWFFFSMLFYKQSSAKYKKQLDEFFTEINTPINRTVEHEPDYEGDRRQYNVLGNLCVIYGFGTLLLLAIPNAMKDRLLILLCGGFVMGIGFILRLIAKQKGRKKSISS